MKTLDNVSGGLAVVSGLVLVALIGLTFADVVLRYVFAAPILGAKDLLEMGMVTVVALAFPFTWRIGGHIVVDLIPDYGIGALNRGRDVAVRAIGFLIFALLAWRAWLRADDAALFNEATNMIELPVPAVFPGAGGGGRLSGRGARGRDLVRRDRSAARLPRSLGGGGDR